MISEVEFWEEWKVTTEPTGDLLDFESVKNQPLNHVWTITESGLDEDGNWYAFPGIHRVNCLGYVLTEKEWDDQTEGAIYFLDDIDDGCTVEGEDPDWALQ